MSEYETPEEKHQRMLEETNRRIREVREDIAEHVYNPTLDKGSSRLLTDLVTNPYGDKRPYEPPQITKRDGLGQVAFSSQSED